MSLSPKQKSPLLLFFITALLLILPLPAQADFLPACAATGGCGFCDIVSIFVEFGKILLVSVSGLALLIIVNASVGLIQSAGNPTKIAEGKKQITGAIIGMLIAFAAFQLVVIIISIIATPTVKTPTDALEAGSLRTFLGKAWWELCSESSKGTGDDVCLLWGDGTDCDGKTGDKVCKCGKCGGTDADCEPGIIEMPPYTTVSGIKEPKLADIKAVKIKWGGLISKVTQAYKLPDSCILTTIVYKESSGEQYQVGCDKGCVVTERYNKNDTYYYGLTGLKTGKSRGIGLTQFTIFPYERYPNEWISSTWPARKIKINKVDKKLDIKTLMESPQTNLEAGASYFQQKYFGNNIENAFKKYNGEGAVAEQYARSAMAIYRECLKLN